MKIVFFCKRIEIEIVLIIHEYKFIFASHISFQLFDFLQLGNFLFTMLCFSKDKRCYTHEKITKILI